jgi:hypothetical protein
VELIPCAESRRVWERRASERRLRYARLVG